ncbi:MAG: lysylphosphatidylglycerol synthase transmembrane domain-containing protein [Halocynthiibacter sp.]
MKLNRKTLLKWALPLIGGLIALALIAIIYRGLDLDKFLQGLRQAKLQWVGVLAAAILLEQFVNGWKWRQILYDLKPVSSLRLTGGLLAGYGANVLVPLGISPLVRAWLVARLEGLRMGAVLTTTIVARFVDGVVFALIAGIVALSGQIPVVSGNLELGLGIAGALNLVLFGGLLAVMFRFRAAFKSDEPALSRAFDWLSKRFRVNGPELRFSLASGVIWPRGRGRQLAAILASVAAKLVAATHFLWSGLATGVMLAPFDYLFLMVFAGFAMVLSRFVRVPGGFVIGSAFALQILGVPDEVALTMILFNHVLSILLVVVIGLAILWKSGLDIGEISKQGASALDD